MEKLTYGEYKKIARDVVKNFKDITGYEPEEVVDTTESKGGFHPTLIDESAPKVKEYIQLKHGIDMLTSEHERLLGILDTTLLEEVQK